MRPDLSYLNQRFEYFNQICFGGELPTIQFRISNARNSLGTFVATSRRRIPGASCFIRVSTRFDMPEYEVENTIIHEMIHYYIWFKRLDDLSAHGPTFRSIMESINSKLGRNITVTHHNTKEIAETDRQQRHNYICVTQWAGGVRGVTVCARTRIFDIHAAFSNSPTVKTMEWYWSCDPWFNRFPVSRSPKVYTTTDPEFDTHLASATPCTCDGQRFQVKKNQ